MLRLLSNILILFFLLINIYSSNLQAQDINEIIESLEIDTALYSGPKDNRINFAIQNRGEDNPANDFKNKAEFLELYYNELFKTFDPESELAQIPYAQYRDFFNLFAVYWPDALSDSEGWNFNIIKSIRDSLFLPWANEETGWATFFSSTRHGGGGGAGLDRDKRVGDGKMYGMGWETFLHEFGHTMPGLLDEYSASGEWSGGTCWETGNSTGFLNRDEIPWRNWIDPETPLPTPYTEAYVNTIGAFEGAMTNYFGCHRPTARSCYMGAGGFGEGYGLELCPICVQRVICYIYQYVNPIENFSPSSSSFSIDENETIQFSVEALAPSPNTQQYKWYVNGKLMSSASLEFEHEFSSCANYEVKFTLEDTTSWIRYDEKFEHIYPKPYRELVWQISSNDISNYDLSADAIVSLSDCTDLPTGMANFEITGGIAPYQLFLESVPVSNPAEFLAEGQYDFYILDNNNCRTDSPVYIGKETPLSIDICAEESNNAWNVALSSDSYVIADLNIEWSTGQTGSQISDLTPGNYQISISTLSGCQIDTSINLLPFEEPLSVGYRAVAATGGQKNGKIYLEIEGGLPEYSVDWFELLNADLTSEDDQFILASGTTWGHLPAYAFDNNLNTKWLHFVDKDAWISYHIPEGAVINAYSITSGDDVPGRDPKNWSFQGSLDGENWVDLDNQYEQSFEKRKQLKSYAFKSDKSFSYYRFYVHENHGDGSIQLQQLEFIGVGVNAAFTENAAAKNKMSRQNLAAGKYAFHVTDQNNICLNDTLVIENEAKFEAGKIEVIPYDNCSITIKDLNPELDYFWFDDQSFEKLLYVGPVFRPVQEKNYYVAARDALTGSLSTPSKGFAIQMPETPQIELASDSSLQIINADPKLEYTWYNADDCSSSVAFGVNFYPDISGTYFADAAYTQVYPEAINPVDIDGMIIRMDAADLDGDGQADDPAQATSSILDWKYTNGNEWAENNWFAYRSNYQNGLGIVDFATIWLQRIQNAENGYQTVVLAYEENPISFPKTAPFEGLSYHFPKAETNDQIFHDDAPLSTKNGSHYLNGVQIDPFSEPNDFHFKIMVNVLTELSNHEVFYTDTKWEGKLGELILYDHALNEAEIKGISSFLREKWITTAELNSPRASIFYPYGVSTTNQVQKQFVQYYPNPTSGIINIENNKEHITCLIMDMQGHKLSENPLSIGNNILSIDQLTPGIYYLIFANEKGILQSERIVKL